MVSVPPEPSVGKSGPGREAFHDLPVSLSNLLLNPASLYSSCSGHWLSGKPQSGLKCLLIIMREWLTLAAQAVLGTKPLTSESQVPGTLWGHHKCLLNEPKQQLT